MVGADYHLPPGTARPEEPSQGVSLEEGQAAVFWHLLLLGRAHQLLMPPGNFENHQMLVDWSPNVSRLVS